MHIQYKTGREIIMMSYVINAICISIFVAVVSVLMGILLKSILAALIFCFLLVVFLGNAKINFDYIFGVSKIYRKIKKAHWYLITTRDNITFWSTTKPYSDWEKIIKEEDWTKK